MSIIKVVFPNLIFFNEKNWKDSADLTLKPKNLQISMPNFKSYVDLPKTFWIIRKCHLLSNEATIWCKSYWKILTWSLILRYRLIFLRLSLLYHILQKELTYNSTDSAFLFKFDKMVKKMDFLKIETCTSLIVCSKYHFRLFLHKLILSIKVWIMQFLWFCLKDRDAPKTTNPTIIWYLTHNIWETQPSFSRSKWNMDETFGVFGLKIVFPKSHHVQNNFFYLIEVKIFVQIHLKNDLFWA